MGSRFIDIYPTFCRDQPRLLELPTTRKLDHSIQARLSVATRSDELITSGCPSYDHNPAQTWLQRTELPVDKL